jgi:uncharacterized protein YgbK (DUF1537 family)
VGIIADNLTGANATGALMIRRGFKTATFTGLAWPSGDVSGYACIVISTESRTLPPQVAYDNVATAARLIIKHGGRPLAKRIDSTLRGNLGSELEAVLTAIGPDSVAVVAPAFPAGGRTTRDGYHYVEGVLLAETMVRNDPLSPVTESHVPTMLAGQTRLTIGTLGLQTIRAGAVAVSEALKAATSKGARVICADAETDADITALGEGMALSGIACVAADPGPLTTAYISAVMTRPSHRTLVVTGSSVQPMARQQLDKLEDDLGARFLTVDATRLAANSGTAGLEVERAATVLAEMPAAVNVIGVRIAEPYSPVDQYAADSVAHGLAEIAARALELIPSLDSVYTNSGDIALAICRRLGAGAIEPVEEVLPLAVCGRMLGGSRPGLTIVTKGSLVGGPDAAVTCVRHTMEEVARYC